MASSRIFQIFLRVAVQNQVRFVDKVLNTQPSGTSRNCHFRRKRKIRTLLQSETGSDFSCLVGAGGFEPPKLKAADLQSVPIGHSGTRPYSFHSPCRTACISYHCPRDLSSFLPQIILQECGQPLPKRKTPEPSTDSGALNGAGDRS